MWKFVNLLDGQLALRMTAYYLTAWSKLLVRTLLRYYTSSCLTEVFHPRRKLMNFLPHTRRLIKWNLQTKLIKNVKAMWKPLYLPSLGEVSLIRNNILTAIIINNRPLFSMHSKRLAFAIYDYQTSTYGNISSRASSIFPENGRHERSDRLLFVLVVFAHTFQTG